MLDSLYLNNSVKRGGAFKLIERKPTPFPQVNLPDFLYSTSFFIEKVENTHYLRCTRNQFFCQLIHIVDYEYDSYQKMNEATGELETYIQQMKMLVCFVEGKLKMTGYEFDGITEVFLPFFKSEKKHDDLDKNLQNLYEAARLNTRGGFGYIENFTLKDMQKILNFSVNPVNAVAKKLFFEKYSANPLIVSDEDYLTIFGVPR